MVFSKFFKPKDAAEAPPETEADAADDGGDESEEGEGAPEQINELALTERAERALPTGASTGSKRAAALYGEGAEPGPTHFQSAAGCHIVTAAGDALVDCTMALGSVAIGYAEPNVTRAAIDAISAGHIAGLSHTVEIDLAERFCETVPCAEKVQFLKTGAEAVAAAVRLARTYTGRDVVIGSGYFGWLDWSQSVAGVPSGVKQNFVSVPFDDVEALNTAANAAGNKLAAIVIEPVVERMASKQWIEKARELTVELGAVLIFDEMKTGFRLATGGYQEYAKVTPDLATFGKAFANGYPLAAVCGKKDLMDAAKKTWISSTLASEASALAAALMVIELHYNMEICSELWRIGKETRLRVSEALEASGLKGVTMEGIDPMWFLRFESAKTESMFIRSAVRHGALFKRGAYNFAALAHDEDAINEIEEAASNAFVDVRRDLEAGA